MELQELKTVYDSRKSFYKKAMVDKVDDTFRLFSYGTLIATANDTVVTLVDKNEDDYSQTTLRHLREFVVQFAYGVSKNMNRQDVLKHLRENKPYDFTMTKPLTEKWFNVNEHYKM